MCQEKVLEYLESRKGELVTTREISNATGLQMKLAWKACKTMLKYKEIEAITSKPPYLWRYKDKLKNAQKTYFMQKRKYYKGERYINTTYLLSKMRLKCPNERCRYEWEYKGDSKFYATCPKCLHKVKVKEELKREELF